MFTGLEPLVVKGTFYLAKTGLAKLMSWHAGHAAVGAIQAGASLASSLQVAGGVMVTGAAVAGACATAEKVAEKGTRVAKAVRQKDVKGAALAAADLAMEATSVAACGNLAGAEARTLGDVCNRDLVRSIVKESANEYSASRIDKSRASVNTKQVAKLTEKALVNHLVKKL